MVSGWQAGLVRAWGRRGLLAWLLWPLSCLFRLLVGLRMGLYRRGWLAAQALPVPVIVVGNVMVGGVGKTPLVMALVQHLQAQGWVVGVIARGYGRRRRDCLAVLPDSPAADVGDEALLIRQRTGAPVFVAARRVEAAQALLAAWPATQIIVSDDGLQHLALQRDVDICVFDDRGTGNGWLLPAGPLREPWPRRAPQTPPPVQWVLHTGCQPAFAGYRVQRRLADQAVRADGTRVPLRELADHPAAPLHALAGIAQPALFFQQLRAQGLVLAQTLALPDHFDFADFPPPPEQPVQRLCTEKDAVKLWPIDPAALAVPLVVTLDPAWLAELDAWLRARLSSGATPSVAPVSPVVPAGA